MLDQNTMARHLFMVVSAPNEIIFANATIHTYGSLHSFPCDIRSDDIKNAICKIVKAMTVTDIHVKAIRFLLKNIFKM